MTARLGRVIYWSGTTAAILFAFIGVALVLFLPKDRLHSSSDLAVMMTLFSIAPAILSYLGGRAALYILAGE